MLVVMRKRLGMKSFLILIATIWVCSTANADTRIVKDGCVKYLETGKTYEVEVQIVDGEDLWPKYSWANVLTKYAIVFWAKEEATVIDIGVFGLHMDTGVEGKDLQGRRWKVAKSPWC
jgi:ribosomal protein S8E